tara:strand:+ start:205 stop:639 length:435 start_codon:yes stop_codon:yes gene_type:complete
MLAVPIIKFKKLWGYQLHEDAFVYTELLGWRIVTDWIELMPSGKLITKKGYAWDGATGAADTDDILIASLFHDAVYQLMDEGHLPISCKKIADDLFRDINKLTDMPWYRVRWTYRAVRIGGRPSTTANKRPLLTLPKPLTIASS